MVEKQIHIDPHVHCRDWEQSYKATIKSVTEIARNQSVKAIFDMPNTKPPINSGELVEKRIGTALSEGCLDGYHLYIGVTKNPEQVREAAQVAKSHPRVVGIKMYADSIISDVDSQFMVFKELTKEGYDGVLAVHAERGDLFHEDLWNPEKPWTWDLVRPVESEIKSVRDHITFAKESGFEGKLYFVHITTPEAVDIIRESKGDIDVYCAVTPHHTMLSTLNMRTRSGLMFKVNSPLRDYGTMMRLRQYTIQGKVDTIESDHAPHTIEEKMSPIKKEYASGIQSLRFYSVYLDGLRRDGATDELIHELTYENVKRIFEKVRA